MTRKIPQQDLRTDCATIIDAVAAGETFIVMRDGEPVAELRPVGPGRRTFVSRDEVVGGSGSVRIDHRQFQADLDSAADTTSPITTPHTTG